MMKSVRLTFAALLAIGMLAVIGSPATAQVTTSTTRQCNRSDVKVTSPIKVTNLTATVSFQLLNGCRLPIGLASYTNTGPKYDPANVAAEKFVDSDTGHFTSDGQIHTLSVTIPNCFYEVDFFFGDLIKQFSTNNQYLGELVSAVNAGSTSCTSVLGTVVTRSSTTTSTTAPAQVLGESLSKPLAETGTNVAPFVFLGSLLLGLGVFLFAFVAIRRAHA